MIENKNTFKNKEHTWYKEEDNKIKFMMMKSEFKLSLAHLVGEELFFP